MSNDSLEQKIQTIAERVARENNFEFVHSEIVGAIKNKTVRIFIDKPTGVNHEDCAAMSQKVGGMIELEELFPTEYILEVSSPGLERGLYTLTDFERFSGRLAKVKTYQAIKGQKNYAGTIVGVNGDEILFDDNTNGSLSIPYSAIAKANLIIDIEEEFNRAKQ